MGISYRIPRSLYCSKVCLVKKRGVSTQKPPKGQQASHSNTASRAGPETAVKFNHEPRSSVRS